MLISSLRKVIRKQAIIAIVLVIAAVCAYGFLVHYDRPAFTPGSADALFSTFAKDWTRERKRRGDAGAENLKKKIIKYESKYGKLAEYWELRALYDVDKPTLIMFEAGAISGDEHNRVNLAHLRKAAELNPNKAGIVALAGKLEYDEISRAALAQSGGSTVENHIPIEMDYIYVDALKRASDIEPDNAYFLMQIAQQYLSLGEWDTAIEYYGRAASSKRYAYRSVFPIDRATEIANNRWNKSYVEKSLPGLSPLDRVQFIQSMWWAALPNYVRMKDGYKEAILGINLGAEATKTLNALHGAACVMGSSEDGSGVDALVALVLVGICVSQFHEYSEGNPDYEPVWLAVNSEIDVVRNLIKVNRDLNERYQVFLEDLIGNIGLGLAFGESAEVNQLARIAARPSRKSSSFIYEYLVQLLHLRRPSDFEIETEKAYALRALRYIFASGESNEKMLHAEHFRPAFERLKKLDYSNPDEWYEKWLVEKKFVREEE